MVPVERGGAPREPRTVVAEQLYLGLHRSYESAPVLPWGSGAGLLAACMCLLRWCALSTVSVFLSLSMYVIYYSVHSQQSLFTAALCSRSTCALACENFRQDVHAKQPRALVN